jgi:hypothetical protein
MPTASPRIPPLPAPDVPLVEKDGTINSDWYVWLSEFVSIVRKIRLEIP